MVLKGSMPRRNDLPVSPVRLSVAGCFRRSRPDDLVGYLGYGCAPLRFSTPCPPYTYLEVMHASQAECDRGGCNGTVLQRREREYLSELSGKSGGGGDIEIFSPPR